MNRLLLAALPLCGSLALGQSTFEDRCGTSEWFSTCAINNACGPGQAGCQNNWFGTFSCDSQCPQPFPGPASNVIVPIGGVITMNGGEADILSFDCNRLFIHGGGLRIRENSAIRAGMNWTRGSLSAIAPGVEHYFPSGSTLSISGNDGKSLAGVTLRLDQAAVWSGGSIGVSSGARIISNAFFNVNCDASVTYTGGVPVSFENHGEFRKLGSSGTTIIGLTFNNFDEIIVSNGTLRMSNSGTCRGPITLEGMSVFDTAFGNYNFAAGTSVQGAGLLRVNGQLNLLDAVTVDKIELTSNLNGPGDLRVLLDMHWPSGNMFGGGTTRVPSFAALRLTGNDGKTMTARSIGNEGAMSIAGGNLSLSSGATVTNSGTLDLQTDASIVFTGGAACLIDNAGLLRKSGGPGTSVIGTPLNSSGAVEIQSGTLRLSNNGVGTGPFIVGPGANLEFAFGSYNLGNGASVAGEGLARLNGTTTLLATVPIENSELTSTLAGPGDLTVTDSLRWLSGNMLGGGTTNVPADSLMTLEGASGKSLSNRDVRVDGTLRLVGDGSLLLSVDSQLENNGLFDIQGNPTLAYTGGVSCQLFNNGTLRRSLGNATTVFSSLPLINAGTVEVQTGTVRLSNDGLSTGSFELASGAVLEFAFGSYRFGSGATISGDGLARMNGTTVLLDDVPFDNVELSSRLVGPGDLLVQRQMAWLGGGMDSGGATIIPTDATLAISSPNAKSLRTRTLDNHGTVIVDGAGNIDTAQGGGIRNDGLFELRSSASISYSGGVQTSFENHGTFRKGNSTGLSVMSNIPFNNHGIVDVQTGTLRMSNSGLNSAQITIADGAVLETSFGSYRLAGGSSIRGDGIARINGDITVLGDAEVERSEVSANIAGAGDLHVTRDMNWNNGAMLGGGVTLVEPGATLSISSANGKTLSGRSLRNRGVATISGTGLIGLSSGSTLVNEGLLDLVTGSTLIHAGGTMSNVTNTGIVSKKPGSGTTSISNMPLNNAGLIEILGGTLHATNLVQTAGATSIAVGAGLTCTQPMSLGGGALRGSGQVTGAVANTAGDTQPGENIGRLSISGNYSQAAAATLTIEAAGTTVATEHDQLAVGGAATLGGTLRLVFVDGYTPQVGDSFVVLTAGSISGAFSSVVGGAQFAVNYTPTSVVVSIVAAPCVGDLNNDRRVNLTDLSTLLSHFGRAGGATLAEGDIDGNGTVDLTDLAVLLANFGVNC